MMWTNIHKCLINDIADKVGKNTYVLWNVPDVRLTIKICLFEILHLQVLDNGLVDCKTLQILVNLLYT